MWKLPPTPPRPEHAHVWLGGELPMEVQHSGLPTPATVPRRGNALVTGRHLHTRGWFTLRSPPTLSHKRYCHFPRAHVAHLPLEARLWAPSNVPSPGSEPRIQANTPHLLLICHLHVGRGERFTWGFTDTQLGKPCSEGELGTHGAAAPRVLAAAASSRGKAGAAQVGSAPCSIHGRGCRRFPGIQAPEEGGSVPPRRRTTRGCATESSDGGNVTSTRGQRACPGGDAACTHLITGLGLQRSQDKIRATRCHHHTPTVSGPCRVQPRSVHHIGSPHEPPSILQVCQGRGRGGQALLPPNHPVLREDKS